MRIFSRKKRQSEPEPDRLWVWRLDSERLRRDNTGVSRFFFKRLIDLPELHGDAMRILRRSIEVFLPEVNAVRTYSTYLAVEWKGASSDTSRRATRVVEAVVPILSNYFQWQGVEVIDVSSYQEIQALKFREWPNYPSAWTLGLA